jgi:hypothetical protein
MTDRWKSQKPQAQNRRPGHPATWEAEDRLGLFRFSASSPDFISECETERIFFNAA